MVIFSSWIWKFYIALSFLYLAVLKMYQICLVLQRTNFFHWFLNCFYKTKFIELNSDFISWVLLILLLICSSLSRALRCNVSKFIWCLPVYLIQELNNINFSLIASFIVALKFWYVYHYSHLLLSFFFISPLIHTAIHSSFNKIICNDFISRCLNIFYFLSYHWILIIFCQMFSCAM